MARTGSGFEITPDILLRAYSIGLFPMAERADSTELFWLDPPQRGIFPLDGLKVSHSLSKLIRQERFTLSIDRCFDAVIAHCAAATPERSQTWINADIKSLYGALHRSGHAHSVEVWLEGQLVGGLYGVALGGAFFGESMFHIVRDASKVALVALVARLRLTGFSLLDTQFVTPHLASLGAVEIPRSDYRRRLEMALDQEGRFSTPLGLSGAAMLEAIDSASVDPASIDPASIDPASDPAN